MGRIRLYLEPNLRVAPSTSRAFLREAGGAEPGRTGGRRAARGTRHGGRVEPAGGKDYRRAYAAPLAAQTTASLSACTPASSRDGGRPPTPTAAKPGSKTGD